MRAWDCRGPVAVCAAIAVCFALPATAGAKPGYEVKPPNFGVGFQTKGSHGFHISVLATDHKRVTLTASKGLMSTSYTVPGRATRKRIEANFGSLGRVSVRFDGSPIHQSRRRRGKRRTCRGRPPVHFRGTFRGTIRFRGEQGYTRARARHVRGDFYRSFKRVCKKRSWKPNFPFPDKRWLARKRADLLLNALIVGSRTKDRRTEFAILQLKIGGGTKKAEPASLSFVIAAQDERAGKMAIERSFFTVSDNGGLLVGDPGLQPITATVALPKPFSGTASYREETGLPPSWTGDLGIWLPGAGKVPLTGEGFKAGLCQTKSDKQFTICLRSLDRLISGNGGAAPRPTAERSLLKSLLL